MLSAKSQVQLLAMELKPGETSNGNVCPKCGGGEHKDKSFSVTRFAGCSKFICFRAKCGWSGIVQSNPVDNHVKIQKAVKKRTSRIYRKPTRLLCKDELIDLADTYGIRDWEQLSGTKYGIDDGRMLFPILTHEGIRIGYAGKHKTQKPKMVNYIPDPYIKLHFPKEFRHIQDCDRIVLVEDILSATRLVDNGIPAVALLGTNLSKECAQHLINIGFKKWDVALDDDATKKAAKIVRNYAALAEIKVLTWSSGDDVKDMSETEFNEIFFKEEE